MTAREKKASHETSPTSMLTGWARQGVQSFVAAQKILMDLAAQENALLIGMVREGLSKPGTRLGVPMAGIAEKGVKNLTAVGKILLDLAADETALAVEGAKEGLRLPAAAGTVADVLRHRVDTFIEMQKNLLDATADQAHAVAESYREGEMLPAAAHMAELARRGIEGFVESEKKFLDLTSHEIAEATKGSKRTTKPPRDRMEVLTKVARDGAEKYIETQKKILELAIDQMEVAAKAGREFKEPKRKEKEIRQSWEELTEKSVKNFVTAEKSLLELAIKPIKGAGREDGRKAVRPRQKTPRPTKKHTAEAEHSEAHVS
jgi:hypothetical protein